ncbi:hypothetical protein PRNP1_005657 [Phytophthora ramorum]
MTKLCDLLGSRPEVLYECMYTNQKTKKHKTWQDGFLSLYVSRRLVVYANDDGKPGKAIDEAKLAPFDWDRKDEEHFETSKFLVEVVNDVPVGSTPSMQTANPSTTNNNGFESAGAAQQPAVNARVGPPAGLGGRPRFSNSKFRTSLSRGPPRLGAGRVGHPYTRNATVSTPAPPPQAAANPAFDFDRNPTSEWNYTPNAVARTPDQVLALLEK